LTPARASREDAYRLVRRRATKVWESDGRLPLLDLLKPDPEVTPLVPGARLEESFDLAYHPATST
jgi:adenylosuccinate lyase